MVDWAANASRTYTDKALAHGQVAGYSKGGWPIVKRFDHPDQWREWYAYYGFRRLSWHRKFMEERDEKTVPTLSPFNFDVEFNPVPTMIREVPRRNGPVRPPTAEERARVAALMEMFRTGKVPEQYDRYSRRSA